MSFAQSLTITTPSDREVAISRVFNASRELVFDALTRPELLKRWLLGPDGWTMTVCELDPVVGGKYRYVWRKESDGTIMGMGGEFREIIRPTRMVATELFDQAWYPGEAIVTQTLAESDGKTTLTITILYNSTETRDTVLKSGMTEGMAISYNRLETLLGGAPNAKAEPPENPCFAGALKPRSVVIDPPQVLQSDAKLLAVVAMKIPKDQIQHVMGPAIGEVISTLGAQGMAPAGPLLSRHWKIFPEGWDFEVGFSVKKAIAPAGRVNAAELPSRKVARTIYRGGYEGLGLAWGELDAWIKSNGHKPATDLWEVYLAGPESGPDPSKWQTELNRPLV